MPWTVEVMSKTEYEKMKNEQYEKWKKYNQTKTQSNKST